MDRLRTLSQVLGLILGHGYLKVLSSGQIYKGSLKGVCVPFLSCYACPTAVFSCPIGSLQHFMSIRTAPLMLIGTLGMTGILVGRMACGWLCPFGLLQDLMYKIPGRKISIPWPLTQLKYATLVVLVVALPLATGTPWFSKLCPMGTLTAGIPWVLANPRDPQTGAALIGAGEIGGFFVLKVFILVGFLGLFVVSKRPFCRTACPMGAFFALFNRYSVVQLKVARGCIGCGACRRRCPVDLDISKESGSGECIRCLSCTACENVQVEIRPLGPFVRHGDGVTKRNYG